MTLITETPNKNWRTREAGFDEWIKDNHPNYNYTGTYDLNLHEFPMIQDFIKEGDVSNIFTSYYSGEGGENSPPFELFPTMYKGKWRDPEDRRHFGIYETKDELNRADNIIHEWFGELDRQQRKSVPLEKTLIEDMNKIK